MKLVQCQTKYWENGCRIQKIEHNLDTVTNAQQAIKPLWPGWCPAEYPTSKCLRWEIYTALSDITNIAGMLSICIYIHNTFGVFFFSISYICPNNHFRWGLAEEGEKKHTTMDSSVQMSNEQGEEMKRKQHQYRVWKKVVSQNSSTSYAFGWNSANIITPRVLNLFDAYIYTISLDD